ncbi:MAG: hypothetical protein KGI03_01795, partial [Patescibacteria group bacterium]|nr:hypothetical protein [Patescibacteria group bacterium]
MSEGPSRPERAPAVPTKEEVIERLRENPQELGPYLIWLDDRQTAIEGISDTRERDEANIDLTLDMGEICREAGFLESALENFGSAVMQAYQMGDEARRERAQEAL